MVPPSFATLSCIMSHSVPGILPYTLLKVDNVYANIHTCRLRMRTCHFHLHLLWCASVAQSLICFCVCVLCLSA